MPLTLKEGFKNVRDFKPSELSYYPKGIQENIYCFAEKFGTGVEDILRKYPKLSPDFFFEKMMFMVNDDALTSTMKRCAFSILVCTWWSHGSELARWLKIFENTGKYFDAIR